MVLEGDSIKPLQRQTRGAGVWSRGTMKPTVGTARPVLPPQTLSIETEWYHRNTWRLARVHGRKALGSNTSDSFSVGAPQPHPHYAAAWSWIWGGWVHSHLDSWSHSTPSPPTSYHSLALGLRQTQWRKGCNLGLLLDKTADTYTGSAHVNFNHMGLT